MKHILFLLLLCSTMPVLSQAQTEPLQITHTFHVQSAGGWDYLAINTGTNSLFVSHGTQVNILDKRNGDSLGVIENTTGVHGIAFDQANGKGYTSNGRLNNVTIFDLATYKTIGEIATGQNPDAILYEPFSKKIITCNGRSNDLTVIDPVAGKVIATIAVGGKPETAVSDEKGKLYVNVEDKNEIVEIELKNYTVTHHWPIGPGEEPSGLAIDNKTHRLFAGCSNKLLMVVNTDNGKVVAQVPIGDGCDGIGFDGSMNMIYSSNGEGSLSVIKEVSADKFEPATTLPTKKGARTIAVDLSTHLIYLPTADFEPAVAGAQGRPKMIPGTFQVLVIGRK